MFWMSNVLICSLAVKYKTECITTCCYMFLKKELLCSARNIIDVRIPHFSVSIADKCLFKNDKLSYNCAQGMQKNLDSKDICRILWPAHFRDLISLEVFETPVGDIQLLGTIRQHTRNASFAQWKRKEAQQDNKISGVTIYPEIPISHNVRCNCQLKVIFTLCASIFRG